MTENEKMLIERQEELLDFAEQMLYYAKTKNNEKCIKIYSESKKASETIIKAFEELEQYRAIGTVEECRETRERQILKKYKKIHPCKSITYYQCPCCDGLLHINENFCGECGQAILWKEEE